MRVLYLKGRTVRQADESDQPTEQPDIIEQENIQLPRGMCNNCKQDAHGNVNADHCGHCRCCKK